MDISTGHMETKESKLGRSFLWLNAAQFLGALNDNIFKLLLILFLIGSKGSASASSVTSLANAVFVIPFLLFLAYAGKLADRLSKRDIIVRTKIVELAVMLLACAAFLSGSEIVLYLVLFMMALQSAFFGPCKYGIIPELLPKQQLAHANSILHAFTYLAIIVGTAAAPALSQITSGRFAIAITVCVGISALGLLCAKAIEPTKALASHSSASALPLAGPARTLWYLRAIPPLLWAVLASAYFWLIGAVIYLNVIPYGLEHLGLTKEQSAYLFLLAAAGVGAGCLAAGRCSPKTIPLALIPLGALGLALCTLVLGVIGASLYLALTVIFLTGVSAGLFIVPVRTYVQYRSPAHRRGEIIAASSFLGWVGILSASGVLYLLSHLLGFSSARIFVACGLFALVPAVVVFFAMAEHVLRFGASVLARTFYRVRVVGAQNVPSEGGTLVVCNHFSYVDPLLLNAAQGRDIRFLMDRGFYNIRWLRSVCDLGRTIPISSDDPPRVMAKSLRRARTALDAGELLCVFAEGAMTRNGNMHSFKRGFEKILAGSNHKIIPAYIGGMWPSVFGYYDGRPFAKLPKKFRPRVCVHFGEPMPAESTAEQVRLKVMELSCDYYNARKSHDYSLTNHFIRAARKNLRRRCICDSAGKTLNYGQTLTAAIALAKEIAKLTGGQQKVGIMLPPSVGAALANVAVTMLGKVPVNLNYIVSEQIINSAIQQCRIKCVITSERLLEKSPHLQVLPHFVFLEDIAERINARAKIAAYLKARFMPRRILANTTAHSPDDLATIIFSSGSTGKPKGVMLSHYNILFNIEAMCSIFKLRPDDNLCAVLPFFHSFGFTCCLWLPIVRGVSVSFVTNPLDGKLVGKTARENRSTVFFAAPTFLQNYIRRTEPQDFATLRFIITGAERLKEAVADAFGQRFGIRPKQGYGTTELSPVVALSIDDVQLGGVQQAGCKEGTVGHPIPGVGVKIVRPEDFVPVPAGQNGLLMVRGPNVMLGYLNNPQETAKVLQNGWYNTGDISCLDEDGFLTITDRISRFSKIAGEMVPHVGVEQVYHKALNTPEQLVAVTSVPDSKKGEELVVLYLPQAGNADELHKIITDSPLPNIWKPKRENYVRLDSLPTLGSGKLDITELKAIALSARTATSRDRILPKRDQEISSRQGR